MISVKEVREIEKKAQEMGISEEIMMENAGANVAKVLNEKLKLRGKSVLVFCGTGNNAGDGLVFARHALIYGAEVDVYFVKDAQSLRSEIARKNYAILSQFRPLKYRIRFYSGKLPKLNPDILVDSMLGTGIKGEVSEDYVNAIKRFNALKGYKVSIDCPSGVECDTGKALGTSVVAPDLTITFYDTKKGLKKENSGKVIVADLGFPKI